MNFATIASVGIGLDTLRVNPLRTVLSTLGIIIGAASLVAVLSLGDGLERFGRQQLERTTDLQSVVIQPRTTQSIDGQIFPIEGYPVFGTTDAEALLGSIPEAKGAAITLTGQSPIIGTRRRFAVGDRGCHPRERGAVVRHEDLSRTLLHFGGGPGERAGGGAE